MIVFLTTLLLMAQGPAADLGQIRADANPEHRAKLAVEYAAAEERSAEEAYGRSDIKGVAARLKAMLEGVELAHQSLISTGKSPRRHPGPFKSAELKTQDILRRLGDLEKRMDADERAVVAQPRVRVQEIHDEWFDGIMSGKK